MGVTHHPAILGELVAEVDVAQEPVLLRRALPGPEVYLVDADWRLKSLGFAALRDPALIGPLVFAEIPHHGRSARSHFGGKSQRVGFVEPLCRKLRLDAVLVQRAVPEARYEALPDARRLARLERRRLGIP